MIGEYNLVDEPWICLMKSSGNVEKAGIREALHASEDFLDIGGESRLQDMAVLRMLVAITVTILYRYDENGMESGLEDMKQAVSRWKKVWQAGRLPGKAVDEYLEKWHDRFFLLGGERPFYQLPETMVRRDTDGTPILPPFDPLFDKMAWISAATMNGIVLESSNSVSPFTDRMGDAKNRLPYDEAARWLMFYMAFADCAVGHGKYDRSGRSDRKASSEMTWPSGGALVCPIGRSLFETLMFCSMLADPDRQEILSSPRPAWERDVICEIRQSPVRPDNLPELYTQQARRLILKTVDGYVTGTYAAAGDKYDKHNAWRVEPMFMWTQDKMEGSGLMKKPKHHQADVSVWREFENIAGAEDGVSSVRWLNRIGLDFIFPDGGRIPYRMTDISYGSMNSSVAGMTFDSVTVDAEFFEDTRLRDQAVDESERVDGISKAVQQLAFGIAVCQGADRKGPDARNFGNYAQNEYYDRIGRIFRRFLAGEIEADDLYRQEFRLAEELSDELVMKAGSQMFLGHGEEHFGKYEKKFRLEIGRLKRKEEEIT